LQRKAETPYPESLRRNIIAHNLAAICLSPASYQTQIAKALARGDWVSVNHRMAALLASVFDIIFALNRQTHPGEKRLLEQAELSCSVLPLNFRGSMLALAQSSHHDAAAILQTMDALVDEIIGLCKAHNGS
jgi:hypothetical protein